MPLAIGAVNTLVRTEHGYKGYNTDGAGLKRVMDEAGISITGGKMYSAGGGRRSQGSCLYPCKVRCSSCLYLKPQPGESCSPWQIISTGLQGGKYLFL